MLTAALGRLFAVAEAYPQLRATENFQQLQAQLADVEQKIAVARQVYNDTVLSYENALETVPTSIVAGWFNFRPREYFKTEDATREAPQRRLRPGRGQAPPPGTPRRPAEPPVELAPMRKALLLAAALVALALPGAAGAYSLPAANIAVTVAPDGSLAGRRAHHDRAAPSTARYRDIPLRNGESIDRIQVSEQGETLHPRRVDRARLDRRAPHTFNYELDKDNGANRLALLGQG